MVATRAPGASRPARGLASQAGTVTARITAPPGRTVFIAGGVAAVAVIRFREEIASGLGLRTAECEGSDILPYVVGGVVIVGAAAYTMAGGASLDQAAKPTDQPDRRGEEDDIVSVAVADSVVELTRLYKAIDVDGDGDISLAEFSNFLEDTMGAPCDPAKLAAIDSDLDGRVSYDEFIQMWAGHSHSLFSAAGGDTNDGPVAYADLKRLIPPNVPVATSHQLMMQYDSNNDGKLTFPEFFLVINAAAKVQQIEGMRKRSMTPRAKRQAVYKAKRAAALAQAVQAENALNADRDD